MKMVTRDICGSEGGYRKHRRMKEEKCQPCKDAHNVHRRATYNPDKNREHQKAYKSKPEKQELLRQLQKKYQLSPEEKAKRALERKAIAEKRKQLRKAEKRAKYEAYLAEIAERKALRIATETAEREERNRAKEERRAQERLGAEIFQIIEKELKQKAKEQRRQERLAVKEAAKAEKARLKEIERERLNNQHGTSIGDYERCRKNNPTACGLCLAVAAKYQRDKFKSDPKYKLKEKQWRKNNPHKVANNSRDRARRRGALSEYYTRQQIFDRDGYDCYLCSTPVDLNAPHVQGQPGWETYPHVEHVIPLSKGGDDTLSNVKIAHAKCNIDKGVRLLP
jgi:5-methylcytosine-specific restriction endonuclease McrA